MSSIPHTLVASLITLSTERGVKRHVGRKWLRIAVTALVAIPLAFFSHFLVDMFPHWDPRFYWEYIGVPRYLFWKMMPDLILTIFLLLGHLLKLWRIDCLFQSWLALVAGTVAMVPDFIVIYWQKTQFFQGFIHFHHSMHTTVRPGPYWGMVLPIIFTLVLASILTCLAKLPNILTRFREAVSKRLELEQTFET